MAKEIVSTPDVHDVADRLHSATIHLLRRVRRVDAASGLSAARLSVLSVLVFGGPATLGRLATIEEVSAPTMSRLVRGLERDGLVVRRANDRDGRSVLLEATAAGRRVLAAGRKRRIAELSELFEGLDPTEIETLSAAADVIETALDRAPSARNAYPAGTAERRWSGLSDDSTGSGGTSG